MFIASAYAQTAAASQGGLQETLVSMLPLLLMFGVLYFIMIRPQMKRQKETKAMLAALAKGDEVSTVGGFMGRITSLTDSTVELEVAHGVVLQMQRSAIAQVLPKGTVSFKFK